MSRFLVTVESEEYDIRLEYRSEKYYATLNGREMEVSFHRLGESRALLLIDGASFEIDVRANGFDNRKSVFMKGMEIPTEVEDYNLAQLRKRAGISSEASVEKVVKASMPGLVVEVRVKPGDAVAAGDPLLVIEAMKMENVIKATGDGTVKDVSASAGTSVDKGDKLLELE